MRREDRSPRRWVAMLSIAAWAIGGAVFNLSRVTWIAHTPIEVTSHGFCGPPELLTLNRRTYAPGMCTVDIVDDGWRPLRIEVPLKATPGLAAADAATARVTAVGAATTDAGEMNAVVPARISVNDGPAQRVDVGARGTRYAVDVPPHARLATTIVLRIEASESPAGGPPPIDVGPVDVVRVRTITRTVMAGAIGALVGVLAWVLIVPPIRSARGRSASSLTPPAPQNGSHGDRDEWRRFVAVWLVLSLYFCVWALVRPPYQTPDEVQHHLRATSVLRHPWVAGTGRWTLDPRFTNPLARWTPATLDKLFFNSDQRLRLQEIVALEAVPWPPASARPAPEAYHRAIASYPTLYYLALFALAEPVTDALHLTPYQSTFAYRVVTAFLAALLWAAVYRTLRRTDATRDLATPLVTFLVLNPMVAFMSSGINPDGVNVPLATLSILLLWRVMADGTGLWPATLALIVTAWTKPSGLQVVLAFAFAAGALWMLRKLPFARLRLAGAVVTVAVLIAWCGFYAWSAPRFVGGPPVPDTLATYLGTRWLELPDTWVAYWGKLGWLEYALPPLWYEGLLALTVISVICVLVRPSASRLFAGYTGLFLTGFLVVTLAGEFSYLPTAGYFLQGRHLLPASIGLAALMLHRVRPVRYAFLALLLAMNVVLLHETVLRYYTRGWSAVPAALPFLN